MMESEKIDKEPLTVLLVEDNADHAELIMRGLENQPVLNKIYHVTDGKAALDYLFRRGDYADPKKSHRPRVILLDLRLPKVDGLEVLKRVKKSDELHQIPVVVLTTSSAEKDVTQAYENHANSYLIKPIDFDNLIEMMDVLSSYWLNWNHCPW